MNERHGSEIDANWFISFWMIVALALVGYFELGVIWGNWSKPQCYDAVIRATSEVQAKNVELQAALAACGAKK